MNITIKLFATFREGRFNIKEKQVPAETTVGQIVDELKIPVNELGIVLVNSRHVDTEQILKDGDTLSIFPLVGGG
ncbi:MAG: MoaD/ThiS family protein [Deltaproteobacteria bacterium]|jgi:molybdopterin converting factor small subunit|nr:MoaD/ThiS family protein [Deltaproteobacteria bacterium]